MSKLVIAVLVTVLLGGTALYVVGSQLAPAVGGAGMQTRARIEEAFQ